MKTNKISLFAIMLVCGISATADAKVTVRKSGTYADAYNQVVAVRQQAQAAQQQQMTPENLPVKVDDEVLAQEIIDNKSDSVTMETLEDCSLVYPNGNFQWGVPKSGNRANQEPQCAAVVELRDADTNTVLATTTLAAGDTMICNIDKFPQSGWKSALETVTLPADAAPTEADVEKVMNEEQKQNAGFKIAAAALLSGIAGNMLAPKSAGDGKLLGTNKKQLTDSAIGAAAGAGVMAASVYSGKVTGDTIKSTAINAASGAVVGNMVAGQQGSGSTLDVKRCKQTEDSPEQDCIAGQVYEKSQASSVEYKPEDANSPIYLVNSQKNILECTPTDTCGSNNKDCQLTVNSKKYHCNPIASNRLINIQLGLNKSADAALFDDSKNASENLFDLEYFQLDEETRQFGGSGTVKDNRTISHNVYFIVYQAFKPNGAKPAYAIFDAKLPLKPMGYSQNDWTKDLSTNYKYSFYLRNPNGSVGNEIKRQENVEYEFIPSQLAATDGAIVDFSNAARRKATLTGAAAGGALGGFSAYQGAKTEVQERWLAAQREYDDSLSKFYCATGKRYLSKYNDPVVILDTKK